MIGVVVPAHDEEQHLGACLASLRTAADAPGLRGEPVCVVVALDACRDASEAIAEAAGVRTVVLHARNVGCARAAGAAMALAAGARWLAFTDADTTVDANWIASQLRLGSDAVCGMVDVHDWGSYPAAVRRAFHAAHRRADGHRHIHGANLGVSARAYRGAGGFPPLPRCEDVALVDALHASGACIAWSAAPRVSTSARRLARAPGGFGAYLAAMEGAATPAAA